MPYITGQGEKGSADLTLGVSWPQHSHSCCNGAMGCNSKSSRVRTGEQSLAGRQQSRTGTCEHSALRSSAAASALSHRRDLLTCPPSPWSPSPSPAPAQSLSGPFSPARLNRDSLCTGRSASQPRVCSATLPSHLPLTCAAAAPPALHRHLAQLVGKVVQLRARTGLILLHSSLVTHV